MIWMFLLAVVLGAVFFKLGVYSVVLGLVQLAAKVRSHVDARARWRRALPTGQPSGLVTDETLPAAS
jgi:hypothetical protein